MSHTFDAANFCKLCDRLCHKDKELKNIIKQHGYPPMWTRPATFQSLILFILEQQVSLASAYAAFKKAGSWVPGYKDQKAKMEDAYNSSIVNVLIKPVEDNSFFFNTGWGNTGYNYSNSFQFFLSLAIY